MRVLMIPLIVMSAVAGELTSEPDTIQMRGAFEQKLAMQVRDAIAIAAETGGPELVEAIRQNGTDRFKVRTFEKRACAPIIGQRGYKCDFAVNIDVVNGSLQHTLTGRFFVGPQGLTFAQEEQLPPPSTVASVL